MLEQPRTLNAAAPAVGAAALLVGVVTLVVGASGGIGALWVVLSGGTLRLEAFLPLLPIAIWGYSMRFVRWHMLIRRAVPSLGLAASFRAQATGYGLVATPGRLGEIWKLYLVERATGVSVARGAAAMVVERLTDMLGFAGLAVVAAFFLSDEVAERPSIAIILGCVGLVAAIVGRPIIVRRLAKTRLAGVVEGGDAVFRPRPVIQAVFLIVIARLGDSVLLWGIISALGYPVTIWHAVLILASSGLIGGVSLLPAGIGAVEATAVAFFATAGVPAEVGLAAILLTRALILWFWVAFGLLLFGIDHVIHLRAHPRPA